MPLAVYLLGLVVALAQRRETRSEVAKSALWHDISELNAVVDGSLLPNSLKKTMNKTIHVFGHSSQRLWFGLVYGLPMLFARSAELDAELPILRQWLVDVGEPRWRELPEDPRWGVAEERTQITSKYTRYNALGEALRAESSQVRKIAGTLKKFLLDNLVHAMQRFPEAIAAMPSRKDRSEWKRRLQIVGEESGGKRFPVSVHVQSWMNAHRSDVEGERGLKMHDHSIGWHGYYLVDAMPSNTSYLTPRTAGAASFGEQAGDASANDSPKKKRAPQHVLFSLNNSDGVLVLLCGGIRHGVLNSLAGHHFSGKRPRVSMAFDFSLSTAFQNMAVTHPNAAFGSFDDRRASVRELDQTGETNSWMELASADELRQALGEHPVRAFNYNFAKHYSDRRDLAPSATWGGIVQLSSLVGPFGSAGRNNSSGHPSVTPHEDL